MTSSGARSAPVRKGEIRAHNLRLILDRVLASPAEARPSRADLATATSLARSAVSSLVDELLAAGLIREESATVTKAAGRPAVPLAPGGLPWVGLGLEINVDYIGYRLVDLAGTVVAERLAPIGRSVPPHQRIAQLAAIVTPALATIDRQHLVGVRLAVPGLVDAERGMLLRAPNIGWNNIDIAALIRSEPVFTDTPLVIGNEAVFGAIAERGARPEEGSFVFVSGGVGIGAAIIVDGVVFAGERGWAGELGHVSVDPAGPRCRCGATGCLESVAGARQVLGRATSQSIADRAAVGDAHVLTRLERAGTALGIALAGLINLVDVPTVVLGGYLGDLLPWLQSSIETELCTRVLSARWSSPTVTASTLRTHPALAGAAHAALAPLRDDPARYLRR